MAQDDSVYQDDPYQAGDPTAMFQKLSQTNNPMQQGLMVGGMNPAMEHQRAVSARMSQILQDTGEAKEGEDPLDFQMRQAKAVGHGFSRLDPQVSIHADQQMLRLQNAKAEQDKLNATTEYQKAETTKTKIANASDPMVWVQMGKDKEGLPTASTVGKTVSMVDEKGAYRAGWTNDLNDELQAAGGMQPGMQPMKQSEYLKYLERINEGKNLATLQAAQMRLTMMQGSLVPPEQWQGYAKQVAEGLAPPMGKPPLGSRNVAAMPNYQNYRTAMQQIGEDPDEQNENVFKENAKVLHQLDSSPNADLTRRFNVAVQHAELLKKYFAAQKNHDTPALNWIENKWADITGKPIPNTVSAMNEFVADEWVNGIVGIRPALHDRVQAQVKISRNSSDSQFNNVMDGWSSLGSEQMDGLRREMLSGLRRGNGENWSKEKLDQIWYGDATHLGKVAPETMAVMKAAESRAPGGESTKEPTVHVIGPDGHGGTIPKSQLGAAKAAGYKEG